MIEQHSRRLRFVRRSVMAVAVMVLLVNAYTGTYIATRWAIVHGHLNMSARFNSVFSPLEEYGASDLPGGRAFEAFVVWCNADGHVPYGTVREMLDTMREIQSRDTGRGVRAMDGNE